MKIAIVDISTKNHASLIENWLKVAKVNGWDVEIFVSTAVLHNIDSSLIENIQVSELKGRGALHFLNSVYRKYKMGIIDKVVITSLQSNYFSYFFSKIKKCDLLLTIHNVNAWTGKSNKHTLRYLIKSFIRNHYLKYANKLIVSSDNLLESLTINGVSSYKIVIMPFKLTKEHSKLCDKKYIVYPGIISKDRKGYDVFFRLCEDFESLNFILLGSAEYKSDQSIVDRFKSLTNVVTFDDYVPRDQFDYYIDQAAVVFGEINVIYENFEFTEVYGKTKDTGLSYFTVEQRIPLLVNVEFENHQMLNEMTYYFNSYEQAKKTLGKLVEKNKTYSLSKLTDYSLDTVANRLRNNIC